MTGVSYLFIPVDRCCYLLTGVSYLLISVDRWLWRKRLRLTAYGLSGCESPVNLHNQQMLFSEHQFWERVVSDDEHSDAGHQSTDDTESQSHVLPVLALNEVYIGETLSSRYHLVVVVVTLLSCCCCCCNSGEERRSCF